MTQVLTLIWTLKLQGTSLDWNARVAFVRACVRACGRACGRACVMCVRACVLCVRASFLEIATIFIRLFLSSRTQFNPTLVCPTLVCVRANRLLNSAVRSATPLFELVRLEGSPKKGDADGSDGEDQPEVVLQEPEDEEDNDDYAKSYFDPGDDDEDDGDDVDKED